MAGAKIKVDTRQVEHLGEEVRAMVALGFTRLVDRAEQLLAEEAPHATGNLKAGVSSDRDLSALRAELIVSARSGRIGVEGGLLHLSSGKTREISLRGRPAFDYAEAVARGTGIHGPKNAVIRPKSGRALLIPIAGGVPPSINGKPQPYITSGGQTFVMRRFSKGMKANPFDVRAAQKLEREAGPIFEAVVAAFASQNSRQ